MAETAPEGAWPYLIEKGSGATTQQTYEEWRQALQDGDTDKAAEIYNQACRDASGS